MHQQQIQQFRKVFYQQSVDIYHITPSLCKNSGGVVKCLSEFYDFSLGPNLLYTFDRASLGCLEVSKKKKERTEAKQKDLSTRVVRR